MITPPSVTLVPKDFQTNQTERNKVDWFVKQVLTTYIEDMPYLFDILARFPIFSLFNQQIEQLIESSPQREPLLRLVCELFALARDSQSFGRIRGLLLEVFWQYTLRQAEQSREKQINYGCQVTIDKTTIPTRSEIEIITFDAVAYVPTQTRLFAYECKANPTKFEEQHILLYENLAEVANHRQITTEYGAVSYQMAGVTKEFFKRKSYLVDGQVEFIDAFVMLRLFKDSR